MGVDDERLTISPASTLVFRGPFNAKSISVIYLINDTKKRFCFKIKSNAPKDRMYVTPHSGVVEPGQSVINRVTLVPLSAYRCLQPLEHVVLVQSLDLGPGLLNFNSVWSTRQREIVNHRLTCSYEPVLVERKSNLKMRTCGLVKSEVSKLNYAMIESKVQGSALEEVTSRRHHHNGPVVFSSWDKELRIADGTAKVCSSSTSGDSAADRQRDLVRWDAAKGHQNPAAEENWNNENNIKEDEKHWMVTNWGSEKNKDEGQHWMVANWGSDVDKKKDERWPDVDGNPSDICSINGQNVPVDKALFWGISATLVVFIIGLILGKAGL